MISLKERWSTVQGLSRYKISDRGRIKNATTNKIKVNQANPNGSPTVKLQNDWGKYESFLVKWLVYRAFNDGHYAARQIKNLDGDKTNVSLQNLGVVER
jgi:hypothetical protein